MMSRIKLAAAFVAGLLRRPAAFVSLGLALLFAQPGQAEADPLKFFKNYFVTGDYVVAGVGLDKTGVSGLSSGTIHMGAAAQEGAEAVAAFLYWQVVSSTGSDAGALGAMFDGQPLSSPPDVPDPGDGGPLAVVGDPNGTASCLITGGGSGNRLYAYRADVLRFLPLVTGRRRINGDHTVALPDGGGSSSMPRALGASLVVIYRHPNPAEPLKAIVIYDGNFTKQPDQTMAQTIAGFYDPAPVAGQITHIAGSGQWFLTERLTVPGNVFTNPFQASQGKSWDNFTTSTSSLDGASSFVTSVQPYGLLQDCLTWGAVIYRTQVNDGDGDGLLDRWESGGSLSDPNGQPLPNLNAMGATPSHQDLFVEVGYMSAGEGTTYGGMPKPAHTHLPTHAALKLVGDAFKNAPVSNPDSSPGINVHFDVGNSYPPGEADPYIIRDTSPGLARGGEAIDETVTVCARGPEDPPWVCQFSAYPGTVGWKTGFKFLRDQLLNTPPPLTPEGDDPCDAGGNDESGAACERRFDRNRKDMFHYILSVHALGLPMATCLNQDETVNAECQQNDPKFHVPRTNSGAGDFPGGDGMLALGAFADAAGKPVGTPFMQGSTLMHELGHAFELTHAGVPPLPPEPNCKPNYLSVMNYLFQLRGLFDDDPLQPGVPHVDFSGEVLGAIDESSLTDGPLSGTPRYHTGWYAPRSASSIGSAAKNHCDGSPLTPAEEADRAAGFGMVRVDGTSVGGSIDWNLDPSTSPPQDVNFDGITATLDPLVVGSLKPGSNDWANLRLNQLGSRRNVGGLFFDDQGHLALGPLSLDVGRGDIGRGDIGRGDIGRGDIGRGDIGRGDIGRGDIGRGDIGRGDIGRGDIGAADEVDAEIATASGNTPPNQLRACVIGIGGCTGGPFHRIRLDWKPPNVGSVVQYLAYRFRTDDPAQTKTLVGQRAAVLGAVDYFLIDSEELPNERFSYYVVAQFVDDDGNPLTPSPESGPSNFATVTAVNDPPVANDKIVPPINEDSSATAITLVATDDDSASIAYSIVTSPSHGTLTGLAPNVTYTPYPNYFGPDSFSFKANAGSWSSGGFNVAMSSDSDVATVSITVNPVNDAPSFTKGTDQTVNQNAGAQSVPGWATNISTGPANESGQSVGFIVTNNNNALFSAQPAISPNGTLSYTPALNASGVAMVTVKIHDNGGTGNGGVDTSGSQIFTITLVATTKLTAATPADIWFGLKYSSDVGTKFDVKVEVLKNDTVVASRTISNVTLGSYASSTYNPSKAVLKKIDLSPISPPGVPLGAGEQLKLKVYAKVNSMSSHSSAKATLWFNIPGPVGDTSSHLHATIGGAADKYFLVGTSSNPATFALKKTDPGSGLTIQSVDVIVDKVSGFKPFGTWSIVPVP